MIFPVQGDTGVTSGDVVLASLALKRLNRGGKTFRPRGVSLVSSLTL